MRELVYGGLAMVIGASGAGLFWWHRDRVLAFRRRALRALGVIVSTDWQRGFSDSPTSFPSVRWVGPDGRERVFEHPEGMSPSPWRLGAVVTVLYDPADHDNARMDTNLSTVVGAAIGVTTGIGIFVVVAVTVAIGLFSIATGLSG